VTAGTPCWPPGSARQVIGTTGLSPEESETVRQAAREIAIVWAPNIRLEVNLLLGLVEEVARRLGGLGRRDHGNAPSRQG
jgi:dihydrodipicolinate reductase